MKLIARNQEIEELRRLYKSNRSEFVIVYGRRRIGKTFLVNQVFQDRFTFTYVGARKQPQRVQLQRFARQLVVPHIVPRSLVGKKPLRN